MAVKPSGEIKLNESHPLYANVVACLVVENDGTVRELVSGNTGTSVTPVTGFSGDVGSGVACSVDMGAELPVLDGSSFRGDGAFTFAWFGDHGDNMNSADYLLRWGNAHNVGTGMQHNFWDANTVGLRMRSGSGAWTAANKFPVTSSFSAGESGILAISVTSASAVWTSNCYADGNFQAATGTPTNTPSDWNDGSTKTHLTMLRIGHTTGTPAVYMGVIFDAALNETQLDAWNADPWDLVESAVPSPLITGVTSSAAQGDTVTLTMTNGLLVDVVNLRDITGTYVQAQTIASQIDSEITFSLAPGDVPYSDENHTIQVQVVDSDTGATHEETITHTPPSGYTLRTLTGTQVTDDTSLGYYLSVTFAAGDQIAYQTSTTGDDNTDTWEPFVGPDGVASVSGGVGTDSFDYIFWDADAGRFSGTFNLYDSAGDIPSESTGEYGLVVSSAGNIVTDLALSICN